MNSEQRRLYLRVTVKLMLGIFILGLALVFLHSLPSGTDPNSLLRHDISGLRAGEVVRLAWNGRRVIVLKRESSGKSEVGALDSYLLDPDSDHSTQPAFAENRSRSRDPALFVALDYGTDLNCELGYIASTDTGPEKMPWAGGFRDRCRGSWYDDAGRVYKGQRALRNLRVPPYRIESGVLILGEE